MTQNDVFGATIASSNPIVGLHGKLPSRPGRSCGSIDVTIESAGRAMHHGSLRCGCGQFRGWLSKQTYEFLTATITKIGKPTEPIEIHTNSSKAGE